VCRQSSFTVKTRTYGIGRICAVEGCDTRLSAYNPLTVCALHGESRKDGSQHGARRTTPQDTTARRCAFDGCGREFTTTNPVRKYCCDACRMRAFQARVRAARRMSDPSVVGVRRAS